MATVMHYFEIARAGEFRKEWAELSELDKTQLKEGIANGTLTY